VNLDYYATYKIREMEQQANHYRLVEQVREPNDLLATGVAMVGRQFTRLRAALNPHRREMVICPIAEPQCCPA